MATIKILKIIILLLIFIINIITNVIHHNPPPHHHHHRRRHHHHYHHYHHHQKQQQPTIQFTAWEAGEVVVCMANEDGFQASTRTIIPDISATFSHLTFPTRIGHFPGHFLPLISKTIRKL